MTKLASISGKELSGWVAGLGALILFPMLSLEGLNEAGSITLGVFVFAAVFWITEPVPIYVTSLAVILLQVLFLSDKGLTADLLTAEGSEVSYKNFFGTLAHPILILFLGGFSLARAAEKFALDRNLTRILLKPFGQQPTRVALGVMLVTATLSAFMSNTATTAMMMTVALPIVVKVSKTDPFRALIALSIPVGANIGGIATPIGTPPNAVALAAMAKEGIVIPFSTWMMLAAPLVIICLLLSWVGMCRMFKPQLEKFEMEIEGTFDTSRQAWGLYIVFAVTVGLWVTEKLHGIPSSIVAFIPMVFLPAFGVLDNMDLRSLAWEVLFLVAGGISLGISLQGTGVAAWMIGLVSWDAFSLFGLVILFALVGYTVGNLISNTVAATILVPIAITLLGSEGEMGPSVIVPILVIGIIVSFCMILPISTPPNAIALSTGLIETKDLAKAGFLVGVLGFIGTLVFGFLIWPLLL